MSERFFQRHALRGKVFVQSAKHIGFNGQGYESAEYFAVRLFFVKGSRPAASHVDLDLTEHFFGHVFGPKKIEGIFRGCPQVSREKKKEAFIFPCLVHNVSVRAEGESIAV
ncbi:MAG: hypothetical protein LBJ64_02820 [Deltaproteobacteria bacterium]|nr:hypothetical protein [Deltaproteobacteria bacterium]